jgi:hypothetical protein
MKIVETHSHLNGLEYLLVRKKKLWHEIKSIIESIDSNDAENKFQKEAQSRQWSANPAAPHVGFVKDRVAMEINTKSHDATTDALFAQHLARYVRDEIDVGIEILPMKSLQTNMSSGPGYFEGELYNVIRNGRGVPSVPLVMIGIAP